MNRVEAAASATPVPLELVVPALPSACAATTPTLERATQFLRVVARAETVKFRTYDVGFRLAADLGPGGLTASREPLSATALLALRA